MEFQSLQQRLETLSCNFTWKELEQDGSGRTVEMNLGDLEEDYEDDECFEVEWCNLKGYYYAKQSDFEQASQFFQRAIEKSLSDDQKIVTLSCMAWLAWLSKRETKDSLDKVNRILLGRSIESIPEVMAEKAFAMVEGGGFTTEKFQEAKWCIDYALNKRPDNIHFKFIKAKCIQKLLVAEKKVISQEDAEAKEVDQIWQELIAETIRIKAPNLQAQVMIYYALFLRKVRYDFGQRDNEYARKAEKVGGSNPSVLRKVAQFYITYAGYNTLKMNKAEQILQKLLKEKPNCDKALSLYGQLFIKRYGHAHYPWGKDKCFLQAEEKLQKAWFANKKYVIPALDLWRLYDARCDEPAVSTYEVLLKLESLFNELMCSSRDREIIFHSTIYTAYAQYLKKYGTEIARMHECELYDASATQYPPCASQEEPESPEIARMHECGLYDASPMQYPPGASQEEPESQPEIARMHECGLYDASATGASQEESMRQVQEALRIIKRYQVNQDDELLKEADIMFRSVQQALENQEDDVKATFHKSYADFLDKYSKDLAIYYFKTSLESNPYQKSRFTYDPLEELAREKFVSNDELQKSKSIRILEWVKETKKQNQIGEEY